MQSGLLILAGPAPDVPPATETTEVDYPVFHWDGKSPDVKPLGRLGSVPKIGKPETLLVLDESDPRHYRALVLIESIDNARPTQYAIPR